MNHELPLKSSRFKTRRGLEERLAPQAELPARLHQIVDTLEESSSDGGDAHTGEERVGEQLRQPGQAALGQWAQEADTHTQAQVRTQHPEAIQQRQKKA